MVFLRERGKNKQIKFRNYPYWSRISIEFSDNPTKYFICIFILSMIAYHETGRDCFLSISVYSPFNIYLLTIQYIYLLTIQYLSTHHSISIYSPFNIYLLTIQYLSTHHSIYIYSPFNIYLLTIQYLSTHHSVSIYSPFNVYLLTIQYLSTHHSISIYSPFIIIFPFHLTQSVKHNL